MSAASQIITYPVSSASGPWCKSQVWLKLLFLSFLQDGLVRATPVHGSSFNKCESQKRWISDPFLCKFNLFIFILISGCVGSSFLCEGFLQLWQAGATLHRGVQASHCRGLSCCGAQAPDAQAQQLRLTGPAAPWHVGSSQTRAQTRVPCIGRQILNHCATREAPPL